MNLIAILVLVAASCAVAAGQNSNLQECGNVVEQGTGFLGDLATDVDADRKYEQAAMQLLQEEKVDQLDCLADHLRLSKERFSGGMWKLHTFYRGLDIPVQYPLHATEVDWDNLLERLRGWVSARPKSTTALVALAQTYVEYAWDARGQGYAGTVCGSGWNLLEERTAKGKDLLDQAAKLPDRSPEWFFVMLRVGQAQGWSHTICIAT